jgi:hypothetical protein
MQCDLETFPYTLLVHHAFPRGVSGCFERVWNRSAPRPAPGNCRVVRTGCRLSNDAIFRFRRRGAGRFRAGGKVAVARGKCSGKGGKCGLGRNFGMRK